MNQLAKIVQLGEVMADGVGSTDPSKYPDETFALYSIPAFDVGTPEFVQGKDIGSAKKNVQPNDVLLSRIVPHIRRSWVVGEHDERLLASGEWIVFRDARIYPAYLRHFLTSDLFHRQFMMTVAGVGGSLLRARPADVARITLLLPPLDEQRRIAAILDKADALRKKRKRAIALLDSVIENAIHEAFAGEPTTMTLGDVFAVQGGLQLSASRQRLPIETPYLRVANVHRDRLELAEIKTMGVTQAELERTALQAGDVLFVEGHGNANEIGRCAVWDGSISGCSHQNHLIRARPMHDLADPVVMSRWLNSPSGRKHLLKRGKTTSGLNTISVSDVRATPIPSISTEKSLRLRAQIDASQGHKSMMQSQLSQMDAAFTSIQYRAFEGEL